MANRYWRGGSGTWNTTSTTNWSATSGGAGGASVPTSADSVFFDQAAIYTVTMTGALNCLDITVSAGTVTFATGTAPTLAISGSMSLIASTVWNSTGAISFVASSGTITITTNGVNISAPISFAGGSTATYQLSSALTVKPVNTVTLTLGILNLNGNTLTTGYFNASGASTRRIAFGTGNITVNGAGGTLWTSATTTGFTTTGTQTVNVSNSGAVATTISPGAVADANAISFNFTAGTYALTMTASSSWRDLNFTGYTGTVGNTAQTIIGSVNLGNATFSSGSNAWQIRCATAVNLTGNGRTFNAPITLNGSFSYTLQDAWSMPTTQFITHSSGNLNLNGKTLTVGSYSVSSSVGASITFNAGTLLCTAASTSFTVSGSGSLITTAGTGIGFISMSAATAKTFTGNNSTFNCTLQQSGAGALTITGANTFSNIANTTQPATVIFPASTTTTFLNGFSLSGTAGNLITIQSSVAGTQATLSKSSGAITVVYCSIKDSSATGGATWTSLTSSGNVNAGNNTGWNFGSSAYTLTAGVGSYSVVGQTADIIRRLYLYPNAGSYTVSGQIASILKTRVLSGSNGYYSISGQSALLVFDRNITASAGSYTVNGQSSALAVGRSIRASSGHYAVAGQNVTLSFGRLLSTQNGVYSVAGQAVDISVGIGPTPITAQEYFIEIRSFTERRRF